MDRFYPSFINLCNPVICGEKEIFRKFLDAANLEAVTPVVQVVRVDVRAVEVQVAHIARTGTGSRRRPTVTAYAYIPKTAVCTVAIPRGGESKAITEKPHPRPLSKREGRKKGEKEITNNEIIIQWNITALLVDC